MKNRLISLTLLSFLICLSAEAQSPKDIIDKFFKAYADQGPEFALSYVYNTNPWIDTEEAQFLNVVQQLKGINEDLVGKFRGQEKITEKTIGKSYILTSYLIKFDRQPLRFTFQFYKPVDSWMLYSFQFDDSFDDELEKSAEIQEVLKRNN